MGKDYWNWSSRSSKRSSNNAPTTTPPSGCMCAFFHLFHAHPFHHFPSTTTLNQQQKSSPQDNNNNVPLPQAPRNSLEEESHTTTSSLIKQEQHFKIPRKIQVMKTSSSSEVVGDMSPAKTPTLVARLMGLDLLPPPSSPSCSSSSCLSTPNLHHHHQNILLSKHRNSTDCVIVGSSPRRTASDLDYYHHRLSLQINTKEQDLEEMRFSASKRNHFDYNNNNNVSNGRTTTRTSSSSSSSSPSHMARQIVKQVKKNVMMSNNNNRKVGQDITNTLKPREQLVTQIKLKKKLSSNPSSSLDHPDSNSSSSSSSFSPRLRLIETNKNTNHNPTPPPPQPVEELPRVLIRPKEEEGSLKQNQKSSVTKCNNKKVNHEKFNSASSSKLKKQEEPFIVHATRTHNKKTHHPLSNNLLNNINTVGPNLFPIKTEASLPPTKINHNKKQSSGVCYKSSPQQSSSPWSHHHSHRYKQSTLATREFSTNDIVQAKTINHHSYSSSTTGEEFAAESEKHHHGPEFQYITGILSRTLNKEEQQLATTTTTGQRFFHDLEEHPILNSRVSTPQSVKDCIFSMTQKLGLRWNWRLMFDLVDEVLMEVLRPTTKSDQKSRLWFLHGRCCCYQGTTAEDLMERVWKRIGKFPCMRCEFLEDIDGLIESEDMEKVKVDVEDGLEEEGEKLVAEIEGNIWNTLVHESLMVMITS